MSAPKVAIVIYTMHGHIATMAESVKKGIDSAGGSAVIYQISETLPRELLARLRAPPKPNYPIIAPGDLNFWDATGLLWAKGALFGKYASVFVSTASPGGGQESTVIATLSTLTHHGIIYVPLGYAKTFAQLTNLSEVHGSPWGAGTFAAADGSRQPTVLELNIAEVQGRHFWETVSKVRF
ncbi:1,4-benzoquinone reductase [Ganoderma leucocontextum]|nr:1,4-benzoquinone reductase [Ganoderma leucocontextum]